MSEIVIRIEGLEKLTEALPALQTLRNLSEAQAVKRGSQGAPQQVSAQPMYGVQPAVPVQAPTAPGQPPIVSQAPAAVPQPPVMPAPVQSVPMPQSAPAPQSAAPLPPGTVPQPAGQVPTTAVPQQYSFDQLAVALSNVSMLPDGQPKVHALLQQFGVGALFDLPKDKYGEFATALRGIGGVI